MAFSKLPLLKPAVVLQITVDLGSVEAQNEVLVAKESYRQGGNPGPGKQLLAGVRILADVDLFERHLLALQVRFDQMTETAFRAGVDLNVDGLLGVGHGGIGLTWDFLGQCYN